jgi:hypothetical protein
VAEEEIVLPFGAPRDQVPLATAVRSTLLLTSQRAMRARGVFERYLEVVDPAYRERMLSMTGGGWLPIDVALAHYWACDALALPRDVIESIGEESGRIMNQTLLSVVVKLAREAGATPWLALPLTNRLLSRTWQGSSCGVFKIAPKEARLEWIGMPAAEVPYYRVAFGAFARSVIAMFSRAAFVRDLPKLCTKTTLGYRLSWA